MRDLSRWIPVLALAAAAGCRGGESKPQPAAAPPAAPPPTTGSLAPAAIKVPHVDEKEVRALVDAWLAAQNGGNFAAYEALYAQKMEGVKRVGYRTWRFDRKRWLADRQRMFKQPMKVEAGDVVIHTSTASATVDLRQSFQQGKFHDEGPKRLVVAREGTALRIAREEMLESHVVSGGGSSGNAGVHFVIDIGDAPYLVMGRGDNAWASGPPRLVDKASAPYLATRPADAAPDAAKWKGRTVALYGADGKRCDATVESLALVGGGTPHFGEVARWDDDPDMPGGKWTPEQRAQAIYDTSEPYLVGALTVPAGCTPVFHVERGTPVVFERRGPMVAPDKLEIAAMAAFRALPAYKAIQADWTGTYKGDGEWSVQPTITYFVQGGTRFVAVNASEGDGCGDFSGSLWAFFEEGQGGAVRLVSDPQAGTFTPTAVFDSDGDGRVEVIADADGWGVYQTYLAPSGKGLLAPASQIKFPFNDCGC